MALWAVLASGPLPFPSGGVPLDLMPLYLGIKVLASGPLYLMPLILGRGGVPLECPLGGTCEPSIRQLFL